MEVAREETDHQRPAGDETHGSVAEPQVRLGYGGNAARGHLQHLQGALAADTPAHGAPQVNDPVEIRTRRALEGSGMARQQILTDRREFAANRSVAFGLL